MSALNRRNNLDIPDALVFGFVAEGNSLLLPSVTGQPEMTWQASTESGMITALLFFALDAGKFQTFSSKSNSARSAPNTSLRRAAVNSMSFKLCCQGNG